MLVTHRPAVYTKQISAIWRNVTYTTCTSVHLGSCALELLQAPFQPLHVANELSMLLAK